MIKFNIDLKKPEELGLEANQVREYLDDSGNIVKHNDITEDVLHMYVDIDNDRINVVMSFGKYGLSETHGLEDITVREFITEVLKPNIVRLNTQLNKELNKGKEGISEVNITEQRDKEIREEVAREFASIKESLKHLKKESK